MGDCEDRQQLSMPGYRLVGGAGFSANECWVDQKIAASLRSTAPTRDWREPVGAAEGCDLGLFHAKPLGHPSKVRPIQTQLPRRAGPVVLVPFQASADQLALIMFGGFTQIP